MYRASKLASFSLLFQVIRWLIYQTLSAVVVATSVVLGVVLAVLELRNLVKTRQTDFVIRLYSYFRTEGFQEAHEKITTMKVKGFGDALKKGYLPRFRTVGSFFEGIGVLLHRKLVDIGLVDDLFKESIKLVWEKAKPILYDARKQPDLPAYARYFENLYNVMQRREQRLQQIQQ